MFCIILIAVYNSKNEGDKCDLKHENLLPKQG